MTSDDMPAPITDDPPPLPMANETIHVGGDRPTNKQISEAVEQVFNTETMEMKSILNPEQIYHLARLLIFAEKHNNRMAAKIAMVLMELKVSEKGYGRRDMREVMMALLHQEMPQQADQRGFFRRLMG